MIRKKGISRCFEESPNPTYFATRLSLSTFIFRREPRKIWISVACVLLLTTTLISEGLAKEINTNGNKISSLAHFCYNCVPPGKRSAEAKEVLSQSSSHETQQQISDCSKFALNFSTDFVDPCPPKYVGCLIRIHGANGSRSCAHFSLSDCKQANKAELCHCVLCNAKRLLLSPSTSESERKSEKIWQSSETDDEDLLKQPYNNQDEMQDDADAGSGEWEPPPGVILLDTTTPKPTLIPNIRPDSRTTTPISTSGVDNFSINVDMWLFVCVHAVSVLH